MGTPGRRRAARHHEDGAEENPVSEIRLPTRAAIAALGMLALTLALLPPLPSGAQQDDGVDPVRLEGVTRFQTAATIATSAFVSASEVVIASGQEFPDALAGAALAGMLDAPVLLVPRQLQAGSIPGEITDAIDELGATSATLLGGTNAVSSGVENHIVQNSSVTSTERVAGTTRFETAEEIAQRVAADAGAGALDADTADALGVDGGTAAFLATGLDWPDSLAGGPGAYEGRHPVLLTEPGELHDAAERGLEAIDADVVLILGGTAAVGSGVESELQSQGYETVRLGGADRWETAKIVADIFADDFGFGVDDVGLATGFEFADALASAPYLAELGSTPLVLTPGSDTHPTTESFFEERAGDIATLHVFGGTAAVAQSVADAYQQLAGVPGDGDGGDGDGEPDPGAIEGTVVNARSGEAIAGVTVAATNSSTFSTATGEEGDYLLTGVTPDSYTVAADHADFEAASVPDVEVLENETTTVELTELPPDTFAEGPELLTTQLGVLAEDQVSVDYTFDEAVDEDQLTASAFHLYSTFPQDGQGSKPFSATGDEAVRTDDDTVRVVFDEPSRATWEVATRAGVDEGGVEDADGTANPEGSRPVKPVDLDPGETLAPDPAGVTDIQAVEDEDTEGDWFVEAAFVFDQPVETATPDVDAGSFYLFTPDNHEVEDGDVSQLENPAYQGTDGPGPQVDGDAITVRFPNQDGEAFDDEDSAQTVIDNLARAYVEAGTVHHVDFADFGNPHETVDLGEDVNAPSLTGIEPNPADDEVVYTFDENVQLNEEGEEEFQFAVSFADAEVETSTAATADGDQVTAEFDPDDVPDAVNELVTGGYVPEGTVLGENALGLPDPTAENAWHQLGVDDPGFADGEIASPHLTDVTIEVGETSTDPETGEQVIGSYDVTWSFDESLDAVDDRDLFLYESDTDISHQMDDLAEGCNSSGSQVECVVDRNDDQSLFDAIGDEEVVLGATRYGAAERHVHVELEGITHAVGVTLPSG
jgi:putative cell wall-binding protein